MLRQKLKNKMAPRIADEFQEQYEIAKEKLALAEDFEAITKDLELRDSYICAAYTILSEAYEKIFPLMQIDKIGEIKKIERNIEMLLTEAQSKFAEAMLKENH